MRGCASSYGVINHMLVLGDDIYLPLAIGGSSSEQLFHLSIVIPSLQGPEADGLARYLSFTS